MGRTPLGQQGGDRRQGRALLAKADRAVRLLHAPRERQGALAHAQRHHHHLMGIVDLALVDDHHEGARAGAGARQNLARVGRHHGFDIDVRVAEQPADPLVAHVQPLGRARHGSGQLHQVDATNVQRRRHQQRQPLALLLVLRRKPCGKVGPNRCRHRFNSTHPQGSANSKAEPPTTSTLQTARISDGW